MNILFPLVELDPISFLGELGINNAKIINEIKNKENEIFIILPLYKNIDLTDFTYESSFKNTLLGYECEFIKYTNDNLNFYFIKNNYFFYRESIYGYDDDIYRFSFYTYAVAFLIKNIIGNNKTIDIVSISDWHTSLLPLFFEIENINIPIVLNIFDLTFQGIVDTNILRFLNINPEYYYWGFLEYYDMVNILKSGLLLSKYVVFNSQLYFNDLIEDESSSLGLNGVIRIIQSKCKIISPGIESSYDSKNDNSIECSFTNYDLSGKNICKTQLQKELSLPIHTEVPLIIIPSTYIQDDELWLLNSIIPYLIRMEIQLIILGNKLADFEKNIRDISFRLNCNVISIEDNEQNRRKAFSAADIILDVSRDSLNDQFIKMSLKYGVLPIVMNDSHDLAIENNRFRIFNFTPDDLINTIKYTVNKYYDMDKWNEKVKKVMSYDFSWHEVSKEYLKLYSDIINSK